MPSFDVALEPDMVKINNGVSTAIKEIGTRFDFKGTSASVELKEKEKELHLIGDSDFQIDQINEVLISKLTKQGVTINFIDKGEKLEKLGGDKLRRVDKIKDGIESELAKKITGAIKNSKLKVQASIQGNEVRVTGKNRDDLQQAIALLKKEFPEQPLTHKNFRD
ncbi:MAG TPA: YajQ family cyclic di-GMP-binding protein [Ideonella sp.]|uniref:YajQ family cyclic di-GMP-binding protein n=1 Tax=Ideonella sp. TaxID=1929293 RepID=UPI002B760D82|nr:YajQ family cyclic di-GMP-binding protein [Ideonella sp.]HSI52283.1 YajQ family cyclic di-GMP-binding protein [Ideonella sp.]